MILRAALMLVLVGTVQDAPELVRRGMDKFVKRDYAGAIEDFSRAIELDPKEWRIYGLRAEARKEAGDLDGAILDATKAIELNPSHPLAYASRASARNLKKDYDGAIQDYSEALRLAPRNSDHYVNRGAAKLAKEDFTGAIDDFKKALEINPKESVAYQNMGSAHLAKKDFDAALSAFSKAIELEPKWPSPFFERAKAQYRKGDYGAALKDADQAYKLLEAEDPDLHYLRACCLMAQNNGKKAKEAFDLALKAGEGWTPRLRMESLLSVLPDLTKPSTVPFRQKILEKGRELLSKGETDKAIEILEEALSLDLRSPDAYEALTGAYLKRNDQNRGDGKRAKTLVHDAVDLGKGLSPQMQRHLNAVCSQVLASLRWLAHHQMADGRWSGESVVGVCRKDGTPQCDGKGSVGSDLRATSLALLAFQGAGFSYLNTDNYDTKPIGETIKKGLQWLIAQQKVDGSFGDPASERFLEDHAIATLAISESYGMPVTYEPWKIPVTQFLKGPAQKAVDFLLANRGPARSWAVKGRKDSPDPVATGWALFALQSAKLSELKFPADAAGPGLEWLIGATFQAKPPRRDLAASFTVAAAAFQGKDLDGDFLQPHLKAVSEAPPGKEPQARDALVNFLSAQALRSGENGALWQSWCDRAKATLKEVARLDDGGNGCPGGSWDPVGPADGPRGRVITTALNTLALEICYQYTNVFCAPPPDPQKRLKSAEVYFQSALQKQNKGDLDGAIADYTKAIELNPSPDIAYNNRGLAKLDQGDLDGAVADFTKAIDLNPQYSDACNNRGHTKRLKGDPDGALADFTKAIDLNPKDALAYANRGQVKHNKGDLEGAIADCTKAIALNPQKRAAYTTRAHARYDRRLWADALADFRKICDLDPDDKDYAVIRIWLVRAHLGERDAATRELAEILKGRKADDWPGKILRFLVGDLSEAGFLKEAGSADAKTDREQKCEAYFYVGARRLLDGDKGKAKEHFQKCLDMGVKTFTEYRSAAAELQEIEKGK